MITESLVGMLKEVSSEWEAKETIERDNRDDRTLLERSVEACARKLN